MAASNGVKKIIVIIIILAAVGVVFYFYSKKEAKAPTVENYQPVPAQTQAPAQTTTPQTQTNVKGNAGSDYTPPQAPSGGENLGSNIQVYEVDYDGTAYSPNISNLKVGDYIFFKNKSGADFWPQSDTAGIFDAGKAVTPGSEFKFQFTKSGKWAYHDKLNPAVTGVVNVAQ